MSLPDPAFLPSPQRRSGMNCWVAGWLTCFVILVVAVVSIVALSVSIMHSTEGKKIFKSFKQMAGSAQLAPPCTDKMMALEGAVTRYRIHTGHYPNSLKELVPTYIEDVNNPLHCALDPNLDPHNVTYTYYKPTDSTPKTATVLEYKWTFTMDAGTQKTSVTTTTSVSLDGTEHTEQAQSSTTILPTSPPSR